MAEHDGNDHNGQEGEHDREEQEASASEEETSEAQAAPENVVSFESKLKDLKIQNLQKKIDEYETKLGEIRSYVKKMESEMKLVRERAQRDQEKSILRMKSEFFAGFLNVADDLSRSYEAAEGDLKDGLHLILKSMFSLLEREGLEEIPSEDVAFDPEFHEAVSTTAVESDDQDGRVQSVFQPGYRLGGLVVRPSKVLVGKKLG